MKSGMPNNFRTFRDTVCLPTAIEYIKLNVTRCLLAYALVILTMKSSCQKVCMCHILAYIHGIGGVLPQEQVLDIGFFSHPKLDLVPGTDSSSRGKRLWANMERLQSMCDIHG